MKTFAIAALAALIACVCTASAESPDEPRLHQSLVCDTPEQVVRYVELGGPEDPAAAIAEVNKEAGDDTACMVTVFLAQRQAVIGRAVRDGAVYGVIRMRVYAVRAVFGFNVGAPVTWFSIERLPETDL